MLSEQEEDIENIRDGTIIIRAKTRKRKDWRKAKKGRNKMTLRKQAQGTKGQLPT